ncbi:MAG: flippase [Elusimicrobiota bacterium]
MEQGLSQKIIRNILWNFAGQGWMLLIAFFSTPFIVHHLNVNLYGVYTLSGIVVGYFGFLQLGLGSASVKYISQYLVRREEEKIRKVFWSCIYVYLFMGLLGTVLIAFSAKILVEKLFNIPADLESIAIFTLRISSIGFLISMLSAAIWGVIRALERFDILNRIGVLMGTCQIGLTVLLLILGLSLKEIIVSNLIVQIINVYICWIFVKRLLPFLIKPAWNFNTLIQLLKYGGFVTISGVANPILINIEKVFLTMFRPIANLTYYSVPYSLMGSISIIPAAFSGVLFPAYSRFHSSDEKHINKDLHYRGTLFIFFLYFFPAIFFIIFGQSFLNLWIGTDFAQRSAKILIILVFAGLINAVSSPSITILQGIGKPQIPAIFHVIETVLYLPTAYFLIYKYGGVGAAFAWFLRVLLDTILLNKASCKLLNINLLLWYRSLLYRIFPPVLLCSLLLWCLNRFNLSLLNFFNLGGILFVFVLYVYIVWKWGLDNIARSRIREFFSNLVKRLQQI